MKVPGIWHKKPEKNLNLGPKTLIKPGIWYLEKSGIPKYILIDNVIYKHFLLYMINIGKVSMIIDFKENEVIPLLDGILQLLCFNLGEENNFPKYLADVV